MRSAVVAAVEVAAEYSLGGIEPVVLQDTNNTVVWLRPHPVVAKVATGKQTRASVVLEHQVCVHLAACDAPARRPWPGSKVHTHEATGYVVSLWEYLVDSKDTIAAATVAETLKAVHGALATYPDPLPSFRAALTAAEEPLRSDRTMRALPDTDLALLRAGLSTLVHRLDDHVFSDQALHGEPHLGNLLSTAQGARWIDFEAVSRGPLEWDLAFLDVEAIGHFSELDTGLLELLRPLNSARVAIWCWARADMPGMRSHAEHHLEVLRRAVT